MKSSKIVWTLAFLFILLFLITSSSVFAQSSSDSVNVSKWTTYTKERILTDPIAQEILENIEISKQRIAELQNPKRIMTEHEKFIEEQRKIAQQQLQEELDRMNKRHADNSPRAAYAKFVAKYPERYHDFLWDLFDYLYSKVTIAREYRDNILANGGSYRDAQQAFIEHAAISKTERIQFAQEMALKHGLINKVSNIEYFNALPIHTKQAFVAYMDSKGLGEFALNPMYDANPLADAITEVDTQITTQQPFELVIINYSENSNGLEQIFEVTSEQNNVVDLFYKEPTSATLMALRGYDYATEEIQSMNSVSEFTLSAWVKPDYSKGSSEFTILSKENAFKLTINNNNLPQKIVRFSVFDGFKWTTIESYSIIDEEWTHIATKLNGQIISLYINGNLESTRQIEGVPTLNSYGYVEPQPIKGIGSQSLILYGAQQTTKSSGVSTNGFFSGLIDEVVIDNHSLEDGKIIELCKKSRYFSV